MTESSTRKTVTRIATLALIALLVGVALGAAAPAAADGPTPTFDTEQNTTDDNATDDSDSGMPAQGEIVRVTPDNPDADHLDIETRSSDEEYYTSGPHATFTLSEPVSAARVEQPNADVTVLGDGTTIRVEYDEGAAGSENSLYTVELFFEDGSSHSIDLLAQNTDVSLEAAHYSEYSGVISYLESAAENAGYEPNPDGVQTYIEEIEELAEWFDHLFTEHILMFLSLLIAASQNFVTWVVLLSIIAGLAIFFEKKHGWILRLQQYVESRHEMMREAIRQDYENRRNSAAKHALEDVDEIGPNAARYWREADIETVDDMVEVACKGIVKTDRNGRIVYNDDDEMVFAHHGVDDIEAVDPLTLEQLREQTWLSPLILEGRLAPTTALSNIESALMVAEKEYNRGNEVRDARRTVSELIARLSGKRHYEDAETSSNKARSNRRNDFSGVASGGD